MLPVQLFRQGKVSILNPVVRIIATAQSGSIKGTVTNYGNLPIAYAIAGSDTVTSTRVSDLDGKFTLGFLPVGTYTVAISDTLGKTFVDPSVAVTVNLVTNIGSVTLQ